MKGANLNRTDLVEQVVALLREGRITVAVMESCTGGLLASVLTKVPHCGDYFLGGIVAYATEAKEAFGIDGETIREFGVVSGETAEAMADAVRTKFGSGIGIGITGVAGP